MPELCSSTSSSQNFELSTLLCASHSQQHSLRDWTVVFKFPGCKACHFSPSKNCSAVQICDCRTDADLCCMSEQERQAVPTASGSRAATESFPTPLCQAQHENSCLLWGPSSSIIHCSGTVPQGFPRPLKGPHAHYANPSLLGRLGF